MSPAERTFWERTRNTVRQHYFMLSAFFKPGIIPLEDFETLIDYFIPDINIRETKIPFYAVATDLISGKQIIISEGSLQKADVVIRPRIGDLQWADFSRTEGLIQEGESAARLSLGKIRKAIPVYKKMARMIRKITPGER